MREIKFRAWNPETKKMFYDFDQNIKEVALGKSIHLFVYETGITHKTLMQFTGLQDKNGKEIYIGDILSDKWKVEVYQNDEGTFMVKFNTNQKVNKPMSLKKYLKAREKAGTSNCEGYRDCIIIGNIHENPELLNQ